MRGRTILLICLGFFTLALWAIGLVLPVWPTTPFVLVSAACFSSAPRIRARIMKIPFFKEHIENYERRTGLSRGTVAASLGYLWGMLSVSMLLMRTPWSSYLLMVIGAAVTGHILLMAKAKDQRKECKDEAGIRDH